MARVAIRFEAAIFAANFYMGIVQGKYPRERLDLCFVTLEFKHRPGEAVQNKTTSLRSQNRKRHKENTLLLTSIFFASLAISSNLRLDCVRPSACPPSSFLTATDLFLKITLGGFVWLFRNQNHLPRKTTLGCVLLLFWNQNHLPRKTDWWSLWRLRSVGNISLQKFICEIF